MGINVIIVTILVLFAVIYLIMRHSTNSRSKRSNLLDPKENIYKGQPNSKQEKTEWLGISTGISKYTGNGKKIEMDKERFKTLSNG